MNIPQGALPLWKWRGCKAPKTPYFQCCCHPMSPYICWLSLLSPKDPTFLVNVDSSITLTQRLPYFLHSTATGSYFLFQFHRQIDHFCHFWRFCFQIPAFKALTERSKVTFSPNAPNFEPKFGFSPNDPSFFEILFLPNAPAFGSACDPYTRIHLILECPPPRNIHSYHTLWNSEIHYFNFLLDSYHSSLNELYPF